MSGANRIKGKGRLTPANTLRFTFDGKRYTGLEGDTLASALIANGVHLTGRSFKYHRPRGMLSAGPEEPNALVGVGRDAARHTPNIRATVQEVHDGLQAKSAEPLAVAGLRYRRGQRLASPLFAAGFYYKTFMWPKAAWKQVYEPVHPQCGRSRRGAERAGPGPLRLAHYVHCDVLVIGGGAAGCGGACCGGCRGSR
jgi:sarcosine oxidase subunit alpha